MIAVSNSIYRMEAQFLEDIGNLIPESGSTFKLGVCENWKKGDTLGF
jgi:hypothetical protein